MVCKKLDSDGYKTPIILYRLISQLVNQNYGDVQFNVQGSKIYGIKVLICSQNEALNKIICDPLASSVIEISSDVSASSFNSLLNYYGYGTVKIDDENVVDMIVICVSYSETSLLSICVKYLHDHFNLKLVQKLFSNLKILNSRNLYLTKQLILSSIPVYGSYLLASDIIYQFEPQILEQILKTDNLITENEEFLLNRILSYYNGNGNNNKEIQDYLPKLLIQIKWNEIPKEKINPNLINGLNNIITSSSSSQQNNYRIYFSIKIIIIIVNRITYYI